MITLQVGHDTIIEATVTPVSQTVTWTSEDPGVAHVVAGVVTALSEGASTITAQVGEAKAECLVIVEDKNKSTDTVTTDGNLTDAVRYLARSNKRGVGFSSPFYAEDVPILQHAISWVYNWGTSPSAALDAAFTQYGMDFVPMAWNGVNEASIRAYKQAHPQCKYILAFNEPNLTDQANMTPQQAAEKWPQLKNLAQELGLMIVSPAMNYGTLSGYSDPVKWLDEFFACDGVSIDDVCAIALHCYMGSAGAMKGFIDRFDKYNKPIWMTEFCGWEAPVNSAEDQLNYMSETVLMLERDTRVQRYAWFLARGNGSIDKKPWNQLITKTEPYTLSRPGLIYEGLTSFDTESWLDPEKHILMNTCSAVCTFADNTPTASPHFLPMGDLYNTLTMTAFTAGKWVEFQVEAGKDLQTLFLHAMAYSKTGLKVMIDGQEATSIELARSKDESYSTTNHAVSLSKGKHVLRIESVTGNSCIHWIQFK